MSETFESRNPATGELFQTYEALTDAQLETAIASCHQAFSKWRRHTPIERAEVIRSIGETLADRKDALADLMTREMGKLRKQSAQEVDLCVAICTYTADNGPGLLADEERPLEDGVKGLVTYRPIGIVYGVQPWNFPLYQAVRFSISSLMAGNGVLFKHAPNVLGCGRALADAMVAGGLPEGLFQHIIIDHDQSDRVIGDDRVRGVTFTGSPDTGRHIAKTAAEHLKKTVLELGSNDAYVVLADADVESAVRACVMGRIYNNGETCVAAKRFVVVDEVYDEFRERFVHRMSGITLGDPTASDTRLGPMARADLRDKLHEQVEESVAKGATLLLGGEVPDGPGFFYPATVLVDVEPGQPAYDDELFGPVASIIRADDDEDAMRIANDSRFGLGGAIFSGDREEAIRRARDEFDTGMVFVNGFGLATPNLPFGGVKNSGYGREHGGYGIREFVNIKAVVVKS